MRNSSKKIERKTKKEAIGKKFKKVEAEKIVWLKTIKDLVYLYEELIDNKIIYDDPQRFTLLDQHFTIKGRKLKNVKNISRNLKAYRKINRDTPKSGKTRLINLRKIRYNFFHSKPSEIIEDILTDLKNKVNPR